MLNLKLTEVKIGPDGPAAVYESEEIIFEVVEGTLNGTI